MVKNCSVGGSYIQLTDLLSCNTEMIVAGTTSLTIGTSPFDGFSAYTLSPLKFLELSLRTLPRMVFLVAIWRFWILHVELEAVEGSLDLQHLAILDIALLGAIAVVKAKFALHPLESVHLENEAIFRAIYSSKTSVER